jgi:hypothetical protein
MSQLKSPSIETSSAEGSLLYPKGLSGAGFSPALPYHRQVASWVEANAFAVHGSTRAQLDRMAPLFREGRRHKGNHQMNYLAAANRGVLRPAIGLINLKVSNEPRPRL